MPISSLPNCWRQLCAVSRHVIVIGWVLGLGILCARSYITDDTRYGFGMFSHKVFYMVDYEWVFANGTRLPHPLGKDVHGHAKGYLRPDRWQHSYYATGSVSSWVKGYAEYAVTHHKPTGATAFHAGILHQRFNEQDFHYTTYTIPCEPEIP